MLPANEAQAPSSSRTWKLATILVGLLAAISWGWATLQSQRADRLSDSLATARQQFELMQARLREAEKPNLPVSITFRSALLGSGLVATFRNTSSSPLEVAAMFSSEATGMKREISLIIPASGVKEIGHTEGWPFATGQHIRLTNNKYRPAEYEVPGT